MELLEGGRCTVIALLLIANVCSLLTARATLPSAAAAGSENGSWMAEAGYVMMTVRLKQLIPAMAVLGRMIVAAVFACSSIALVKSCAESSCPVICES